MAFDKAARHAWRRLAAPHLAKSPSKREAFATGANCQEAGFREAALITKELGQFVLVREVGRDPFLEVNPELVVEFLVGIRILVGFIGEVLDEATGEDLVQLLHEG